MLHTVCTSLYPEPELSFALIKPELYPFVTVTLASSYQTLESICIWFLFFKVFIFPFLTPFCYLHLLFQTKTETLWLLSEFLPFPWALSASFPYERCFFLAWKTTSIMISIIGKLSSSINQQVDTFTRQIHCFCCLEDPTLANINNFSHRCFNIKKMH